VYIHIVLDLIGLVPEFEEAEVLAPEATMDPFGVEAERPTKTGNFGTGLKNYGASLNTTNVKY